MKNKTLMATGLSMLLAASLYAHGGYGMMGSGMMMDNDNEQNQQTQYNPNMMHNGYNNMHNNQGMMNGNYPGMMMGYGGMMNPQMMHGNQQGMMYNGYDMYSGYGMINQHMMGNGYGMMGGYNHMNHGYGMMNMFYGLNLSQDQMEQINKIQMDTYKNLKKYDSAFTKDSFDKDKYIKLMQEKRDDSIKIRAEIIDRVYKILTPKQKEYLKNRIDYIHNN